MTKKIMTLLISSMLLVAFSAMTMAAEPGLGFETYLDYSQLSVDDEDEKLLTIGGDYNSNQILAGASFSKAVSHNDQNGYIDQIISVYGGYDFMKDENVVLGVIASYSNFNFKDVELFNTRLKTTMSTLGIGLKAEGSFGKFKLSGDYIYGVKNKFDVDGFDNDNDLDISLYQVKGTYLFTDAFGLSLSYQGIHTKTKDDDGDGDSGTIDGFGLGVTYKF